MFMLLADLKVYSISRAVMCANGVLYKQNQLL